MAGQLRHDRDRGRTRRLRRGDQGRPARPEDSRGRDGPPRAGAASTTPASRPRPFSTRLRSTTSAQRCGRAGSERSTTSASTGTRGQAAQKVRLALTGGSRCSSKEQDRPDEGEASLTADGKVKSVGRRTRRVHRAGNGLSRAANPRSRVRRSRDRHLGRLVAARLPAKLAVVGGERQAPRSRPPTSASGSTCC